MGFLNSAERVLYRQKIVDLMTAFVQLKRASTPQAEVTAATNAGEILADLLFHVAYNTRYGRVRPPGSPTNSGQPPQV